MTLTDRIPQDFGNVIFLHSLALGSNNFLGNLPQQMASLHCLKFLNLKFQQIHGEVPSWFRFLFQIQFLNIMNNSFTGSLPPSLSNASRLETSEIYVNLLQEIFRNK
ncbi:hypothetical protein MTR67_048992 [Solanum verrucosum]|uniref:Non-specific serine/threonine protein kinase n=1 Tax=Solanum verrucosum TaxID=315347 RepID=A0AAF0ZX14_SOLVR|nr:hypothetical protein MTR67_048992 [Solanum verrucosum]